MEKGFALPRARKRYYSRDYGQELQLFRTTSQKVWLVALLALVVCFPLLLDRYTCYIATLALAAVIGSIGLNILTGYTGQISIGHGAFVGVGAYSYALILAKTSLPFWLAIPLAGAISGILGILIGVPALRMRGLYLAMATVAFHLIMDQVVMNWESLTGGYQGLDVPNATLAGYAVKSEAAIYYVTLFFTIALTIGAGNITTSKIGRAFCAVRDRDLAAEAIGISLVKYKILAFFISSVYAGVAGALMALCLGRISPYDFGLIVSIAYISMIIVGGAGSIFGSIIGAVLITLLPFGLSSASDLIQPYYPSITTKFGDVKTLAYGLIIIVFLIWEPEGLAGRWRKVTAYFRNWPFTY
ncbi:MAG: branched-chain amino acid ABC transporter permease [Syntrophorhabdales bacterium]|jgi:branched-chain amino acid transport system permease protein